MRNIVELKIEETKAVAGGIKVSAPPVATANHFPVATTSSYPMLTSMFPPSLI